MPSLPICCAVAVVIPRKSATGSFPRSCLSRGRMSSRTPRNAIEGSRSRAPRLPYPSAERQEVVLLVVLGSEVLLVRSTC
uniref:Putative secreted protein n=1 Tax=Anopheles marajoara TaxID=58244 RepID=A0A2M4CBU7_9DIPT